MYNHPMEVIYIDSLFILNLIADYLICLASARICGLYLKRIRYLISALFGAAYSVAVYLPGTAVLSLPATKLAIGILMGLIAFGSEQKPLRCTAVFMVVSAAFGGGIWALSMAEGEKISLSLRSLLLLFALFYSITRLIFHCRAKLPEKKRACIQLEFLGRKSCFMALIDTGNSLSDPSSGRPVMLVSPHALHPLFPEYTNILTFSPVELVEISASIPELSGKFRLLPYSAIGSHGLLPAFSPDKVLVDGKECSELLTAVSSYAMGDGFEALI